MIIVIRKIIEENKFIEFIDLMANQIYYDLDNALLLYKQGAKSGIELATFKTLNKLSINPDGCKPYVVYQYNIVDDDLEKDKVILFDVSNMVQSDKNTRFEQFLHIPDFRNYLTDLFKSKTGISIMNDDIEEDYKLDFDNQVLSIKENITDKQFAISLFQGYAENLYMERIGNKNDVYIDLIDRMIVKAITDQFNLKSVPITKIKDIQDDELVEMLLEIQSIILTTLWDLYEKRFDWKETILLYSCDGTKEEMVDYFSNFDLDLATKIDELNSLQLEKLQSYLKNGLTIYPVCRM